jgi:hypothetical protein
VERGDGRGEGVDLRGRKAAAPGCAVGQRFLREAPHPQGVLDRLARPAHAPAARLERDRHHAQVDLGRGAAVQAQLLFAVKAPRLQRRKIEEAEAHRLLHLVRVVAREEHP